MVKLNARKYIILLAVILLLIFLHFTKILSPVEALISQGLKPVLNIFYSLSADINRTYGARDDQKDLAGKLKLAEETINFLTADKARLKFLEEENIALRKSLNFLNKSNSRFLMADIISREALSDLAGGQAVVINKGAKDGLYSGLAVVSAADGVSGQGIIVGKIINVKDNLAEVYLVTNKNCKLAAAILGENLTSGITSGDLGLTVKMDFIPQTEIIKVNDIVATSGLEQNIPKGLLIGRVVKVDKENNEVWQSATIEPQSNLDGLAIVAVLLP